MAKKKKSVESSGKRKTAIARATVKPGKGRVRVNSSPIEILQPALSRRKAMEPLIIADAMNRLSKVDINVVTHGGGIMGQSTPSAPPLRAASCSTTVEQKAKTRNCVTNSCVSTARCWSTTHAERAQAPTRPWRSPQEAEVVPLR